ncbi:MAG: hypothetical protein ACJAU3_000370 [Zhongshania sp.]|jgi:hypothetical protein
MLNSKSDAMLKHTLNTNMAILIGVMLVLTLFIPNIS